MAPTTASTRSSIDVILGLLRQESDKASIRESLRLTPQQRSIKFLSFMRLLEGIQAGRGLKGAKLTGYAEMLNALTKGGVEFILIGGVAAMAHGSVRSTNDVDVVYRRTSGNIAKLAAAMAPLKPTLRGAPKELPFQFDAPTIQRGLNFTLSTDMGDIDLLGEVTGGGEYDDLLPHSVLVEIFGASHRCVDLGTLIKLKRAAGRTKDLLALAELEELLDEGKDVSPDDS